MEGLDILAPDEFRAAAAELEGKVRRTPLLAWAPEGDVGLAGMQLKLELMQRGGSFKARAAVLHLSRLDPAARARGVVAVSAGNHAIAVAAAAQQLGIPAKLVMPAGANPARVAAARAHGGELLLVEHGAAAFALAERIEREEGRSFVHPFDGRTVALGTGTIGVELAEQSPALDAVVVAIGGGGLAGGLSAALRQLWPDCDVLGVEPRGADTMARSFAAGTPQRLDCPDTIADSLAPPMALPYSFALCRAGLADLVAIEDRAMQRAMALLFREAKLVTEPAGAAALAAAMGPYRARLTGRRFAVIICGGNIDIDGFARHIRKGDS